MNYTLHIKNHYLKCTCISNIILCLQLVRHGNRAPMIKCKTDPYKNAFPEGLMELTKV